MMAALTWDSIASEGPGVELSVPRDMAKACKSETLAGELPGLLRLATDVWGTSPTPTYGIEA
jgi:hypothetical protein